MCRKPWVKPVPIGVLTVAVLVSGITTARAGGLARQGGEFQGAAGATSGQHGASVGFDGDGNFVMVWHQLDADGDQTGILGQRFTSTGSSMGPPFVVNGYTGGNQLSPAVAMSGTGAFSVVWQTEGLDGSGHGVFGRFFDSDGTPVTSEFQVNTYTTAHQYGPAIAMNDVGGFVVVWASHGQDGDLFGIFGQLFDSSGAPLGSEFQVNQVITGGQYQPSVDWDGPGGFRVVWEGPGFSAFGVFGRHFDSAGR